MLPLLDWLTMDSGFRVPDLNYSGGGRAGGGARHQEAPNHAAAVAVRADVAYRPGGHQAQVYRHSLEDRTRPVPDQPGEVQGAGAPQGAGPRVLMLSGCQR